MYQGLLKRFGGGCATPQPPRPIHLDDAWPPQWPTPPRPNGPKPAAIHRIIRTAYESVDMWRVRPPLGGMLPIHPTPHPRNSQPSINRTVDAPSERTDALAERLYGQLRGIAGVVASHVCAGQRGCDQVPNVTGSSRAQGFRHVTAGQASRPGHCVTSAGPFGSPGIILSALPAGQAEPLPCSEYSPR
jgi:hypothetical protein